MSAQKQKLLFGDIDAAPHKWNSVHFSSLTPEWPTPQSLFDQLDKEFFFRLDVCATPQNTKCPLYFTEDQDGLKQDWCAKSQGGAIWCNPPYGRSIGQWVAKGYQESQKGCLVVMLLPARTDTAFFHEYCLKGEIRAIKGRLKFGDAKESAPFPSMITIFRPIQNL